MKGLDIVHCKDGAEAIAAFKKESFDLCIFDVMLPKIHGFDLAEQVRTLNQEIPILFLSAKSLKEDRIKGLKLGADDYITKPFSIEELSLKIEVFLKRKHVNNTGKYDIVQIGQMKFDHRNLSLTLADQTKQQLTQKEADLLRLFIENKNIVLKRNEILEKLWGEDDYFMGRSLDVFISRLRKMLKQDESLKIENIHGVGFKLSIS
jgi:DNA-binding response OmpR family regulator